MPMPKKQKAKIKQKNKCPEKLIRTETGIFFWIPAAVAVVMVPVLTGEIWNMREYTKADGVHYLRYLLQIFRARNAML